MKEKVNSMNFSKGNSKKFIIAKVFFSKFFLNISQFSASKKSFQRYIVTIISFFFQSSSTLSNFIIFLCVSMSEWERSEMQKGRERGVFKDIFMTRISYEFTRYKSYEIYYSFYKKWKTNCFLINSIMCVYLCL